LHLAQKGCRSLTLRMGFVPFATMRFSTLSLLLILAIAAACGGSGATDTSNAVSSTGPEALTLPSDEDILAKAYDTGYSAPDGFFVDERAASTRSYTVHHVLDTSDSFELCTDDLVEAQAWEETDNASRAVSGYYVNTHENARYFEIVRELAYTEDVGNITNPTSPGYARVFKCNHTNRDGVDRSLLDGYAGKLSHGRLDAGNLREFTEYLWQFTFFNVSRKAVIDSYPGSDSLQHTLLLAFVVNQGFDACDRVDVTEWRFTANPSTGEITREFDTVKSFEAKVTDGVPAFCQ